GPPPPRDPSSRRDRHSRGIARPRPPRHGPVARQHGGESAPESSPGPGRVHLRVTRGEHSRKLRKNLPHGQPALACLRRWLLVRLLARFLDLLSRTPTVSPAQLGHWPTGPVCHS